LVGHRAESHPALSAVALAIWTLATPASALELRLVPAWDGYAAPDATTEVAVSLRAPQATSLDLTVQSDGLEISRSVQLDAQARATEHVLLRTRGGEARVVVAEPGAAPETRTLALRVTSRPIVAVATPAVPAEARADDIELIRPAPSALPRHAEAYGNVAAIIVDLRSLDTLDDARRDALAVHVAGCGRLVLAGATALPQGLRAGCGGRFVTTARYEDAIAAARTLLARAPEPLPGREALRTLVDEHGNAVIPVAALLAAYAVALLLLVRGLRRPALVLAVPPLAALVAIVAFTAMPPRVTQALWAEMQSGDGDARAALVTGVTGRGRGSEALAFAEGWQIPQAGAPAGVAIDARGRLVLRTGLLSRELHVRHGVRPQESPLRIALDGDGPRITNARDTTSVPSLLCWRGARHEVPALPPGATWSPGEATPWGDGAAERLLRERSPADGAALLMRVPTPEAHDASWLLIHARTS
jgi:hypothetical protein